MTRKEAKSCIRTIEMLQRLAYNIHGVMDVIDADNCKKIIKALEQEPVYYPPCIDCNKKMDEIRNAYDNMTTKALEQEPTDKNFTKADIDAIVKAINEGWELRVNEILGKIRAEIEKEADTSNRLYGISEIGLRKALKILDKYKAEVRDKECM